MKEIKYLNKRKRLVLVNDIYLRLSLEYKVKSLFGYSWKEVSFCWMFHNQTLESLVSFMEGDRKKAKVARQNKRDFLKNFDKAKAGNDK